LVEEADARECDEKPNDAHMLIVDPAAPLRNLMSKGNKGAQQESGLRDAKRGADHRASAQRVHEGERV
jgi:hypothetical protein